MGTFFGYDPHYILYRLTFAQALTLIDIRNEREKKQNEEANRRSSGSGGGKVPDGSQWTDISEYKDIDKKPVSELPSASDLRGSFAKMFS